MPYGRKCDGGSSAEMGEKSGGKYHHPSPSGKSAVSKYMRTPSAAPGQGNNSDAKAPDGQGKTYPSR